MIFGGLLDLVIVLFLVAVFAEYTKIRSKLDKPFKMLIGSALLFLLAYSFGATLSVWTMVGGAQIYGAYLFEIIGWLFLLIGTLMAAIEIIKK